MAADVAHCCCKLPLDISNDDLERGPGPDNRFTSDFHSPMTGFIVLTRLCKVAAEVHRFHSALRMRSQEHDESNLSDILPTVEILVHRLNNWLREVPNEIRFSANELRSGPNLTMSVIVFILHSATIMNLYR